MTLWMRAGGEPQPLPYFDQDADQNLWSDLANNPDGRVACGWVEAPAAPAIDPEIETIAWVDGDWRVTPIAADILAARAAAAMAARRDAVDARAQRVFLGGYAPASPAFAGHRLQLRDVDDKTNWLTSQISYSAAVAAGFGDVVDASFRTASNATITVTYQEGLDVLLGMAGWGRAILAHSWDLKDRIAAGTPVDVEDGWPE
ncbi:MAG TPA: hypothetical protein VF649_06630 [Sphingomonas sp.]|jgi:hypothetical protein|uniref:DUF4376 domain-containing protein n=1 Tax=Sphingomonas sp. TaxID=28214 RepID=UPI002EDAD6FE